MKRHLTAGRATIALLVAGVFAVACNDSPTATEPEVNPGLTDPATSPGFASAGDLPQGSATFQGPDGLQMDATAEEFIQQATFTDDVVWKTSGVSIRAVPDESVLGAPIDLLTFGPAYTGSLASIPPGTYQFAPHATVDFVHPTKLAAAGVRLTGRHDMGFLAADQGEVTVESLNYFDDVYDCMDSVHLSSIFHVDECSYQLGLVKGVVEFRVPLSDGTEIVQPKTAFELPIMRRRIIVRVDAKSSQIAGGG